jgi:curved DNA-binding protein CbpA
MPALDLSPEECATIDRLARLADANDYYALLGVSRDADRKQIQAAFYELSRSWHPDRFFRKETGPYGARIENVFVALTEAYRVLGQDEARTRYNYDHRDAGSSEVAPAQPGPAGRRTRAPRTTSRGTDPFAEARRKVEERRSRTVESGNRSKAMEEMRKQVLKRLKKARRYFLDGKADYESGNVLKAVSTLALATTYDPKNAEYRALADKVQAEARKIQSKQFVAAAESAESFANWREAQANYEKAVDYGTDVARAYYRLGVLVLRNDQDQRTALQHFRQATVLDPNHIDTRMALGQLYAELGLKVNAQAQFERVLAIDRGHAEAKAALKAL